MNNDTHDRRRVTRAIKLAISRIAEKDHELARAISEAIKTGTYLTYTPVKPQSAPPKPPSSKGGRRWRE